MRCVASPLCSFALVALALGISSCSSDSTRLSGDATPSRSLRPNAEMTGTTEPAQSPSINAAQLPPPPSARAASPVSQSTLPAPTPLATAPVVAPKQSSAPVATGHAKHTVVAGESLAKIARQHRVATHDLAAANKLSLTAKIKPGEQLVIPSAPNVASQASRPPEQKMAANTKPESATGLTPPSSSIRKITPTPDITAEAKPASTELSFRWPVRGRIIRPYEQDNPGINISVPEGTPIKAAEDGVVIYANNALVTYGNLILIRHANGYVTAYAHASEMLVKRNDQVKRGQVIGKAGQTGNVKSPQLHFQIRKESNPVDPIPFLDRSGPAA